MIVADTGGPDGDGPSLLDVLAALGIPRTPSLAPSDVWALLFRRRLITYAATPHCATCGHSTGFPPGWLEARGHQPSEPRPCQCWRLGELPP